MNQNENRPPIELSTLLPVGVGAASLIGICLLLLVSRMAVARSTVEVPDTATPFHYLLIGTEPGISTAVPSPEAGTPGEGFDPEAPASPPDGSITSTPERGFSITAQSGVSSGNSTASSSTQRAPTASTNDPVVVIPGTQRPTLTVGAPLPTRSPTATFVPTPTSTPLDLTKTPVTMLTLLSGSRTPTPTATPTRQTTLVSGPPFNPGTYDDVDTHLVYSGNWTVQSNVGNAYQNTLHVSSTVNNTVSFSFIGQELRLFYISGVGLGTIRITIDQRAFDLEQVSDVTSPSEWVSDFYPGGGTHTVTIRHLSGGSINLDQIIIPDIIPTANP